MPKLEKEIDINEQLSTQRTDAVKYNRELNRNKSQNKQVLKSLEHEQIVKLVGDPFDANGDSNLNKIYDKYVPTIDASLTTMFGADRSKNLDPHLFTFMFDQAMKTHPDTYYMRLDEQLETSPSMQNTEFMQVVSSGDVANFYLWLKNNGFDSKSIKENARVIKRALFDNDFQMNTDGSINYKRRK